MLPPMIDPAQLALKIAPVPPARYAPALQAIAARSVQLPAEWASLCAAASEDAKLADTVRMIAAYRAEQIVGLALGQLHAGRTASVYQPWIAPGQPPVARHALQDELDTSLRQMGARLLQALLPEGTASSAHFAACGYRHICDLSYLLSLADTFPRKAPQGRIGFERYAPADRQRMIKLLDATYQGTLDCPALNGVRKTDEVLDGYEQGGDEPWFFFVREEERDIGCLLLADHAGNDHCELVYMGIVPQARGRGLGLEITRFAQWLSRTLGRSRCLLAVDDANHAAVGHYHAAGFMRWTARRVWVKPIG